MDMALVACLSSKTMPNVGWYVISGTLRNMTYYRSLFNILKEKEGGMNVELGDDGTYIVKGFGSIFF